MIGCVISPLLLVLIMEILPGADVDTNQITGASMKAFMDDVTNCIIKITHGTSGAPPPGALQMGCYENKAFKVPKFIVTERKLESFLLIEIKSPRSAKKVLRILVAAIPYHLLIDIIGRT